MTDTQNEQAATESNVGIAQEMLNMANEQINNPEPESKEVSSDANEEGIQKEKQDASEEAQEIAEQLQNTEEASESEPEETEEAESDKADEEFPLIPKDMSAEEKEILENLMESENENERLAAEVLIARYESMKKAFYKKTQDIAEKRKSFEGIEEAFKPMKALLEANNMSNADFTKALINEYIQLNQNPADKMKNWVKQYNLKPSDLGFDDYDDFEYNDSKSEEIRQSNPQMTEEQIRNATKIAQFAEATNTEGKLMHPHFDKVRSTMGVLVGKQPNLSLADAYKKAVAIEGLQADKEQPKEDEYKVDIEAIRKRAKQAKKASKSVKTNSNKPDFSKMSITEELLARAGQN